MSKARMVVIFHASCRSRSDLVKLYGIELDNVELLELSEASIIADVEELRALAEFFTRAADRKEGVVDNTADHIQFRDFWSDWKPQSADIIVMTADI